jgi:hypothetical protein
MNELTAIRPFSDDEAASFVSAAALDELAAMITSMPLRADQHAVRFGWLRRKVTIGGFGMPIVVLGAIATAAAATGAVVAVNATTVFENNPQQALNPTPPVGQTVPATGQETVIPASVRELASATVPGYGQVQFWGAPTTQGGFCFAIKLPDGSWGGYPLSLHPRGGWVGGSIPGCTSTQEHQVITEPAVPAGQHLTNADDGLADNGDLIGPTPVEQWRQQVKSSNGKLWNLSIGYVEVQGTAATVRDPGSGATAPVTTNGYYLLVEPSGGGEGGDLKVLDVAGEQLPPDYTYGGLLPGYAPGPTKG